MRAGGRTISDLYQQFLKFVRTEGLIREGDFITAGISGGPDSVCLLFMLVKLRETLPFSLQAVHVNHLLRSEAVEEANYVDKLCKLLMVNLITVEKPVEKLARMWKKSLEEAGREVRYQAFREAARAKENSCFRSRIAVAHHMDDEAETVLFRLFRGTGPMGLGGMKSEQNDIIRPLLFARKSQILAFLDENNIEYRLDKSNQDNSFSRNKIRNQILPLSEEINPGAVAHIASTARQLQTLADYIDKQAEQALARCIVSGDRAIVLSAKRFLQEDAALHPYILRHALAKLGKQESRAGLAADNPPPANLSQIHLLSLEKLFFSASGSSLSLPQGIKAVKEYDLVTLFIPETVFSATLFPGKLSLDLQENPFKNGELILDIQYKKFLDYDKIDKFPVLRTRKAGDYLFVDGKDGSLHKKSLKRYFIDAKIPLSLRERIPLLCDGSHVLWVVGYRISTAVKISASTSKVLIATWREISNL
ncbi:MAG: tRNA lysidine(34) synthetase TilS [Lachnospiraceae bacterium]|nr:tRNA lysidine(34) synthetase TilS [Lachnospiraceae bacterium]